MAAVRNARFPTIRAVLFDAGGVLVVPDPFVLRKELAPFGASDDPELYVRAHYAAMRAVHVHSTEHDDWMRSYQAFALTVGVQPTQAIEAAAVVHASYNPELWSHPRPDAVDALRALYAAGIPIGVVSNAEGQIERVLRERAICHVGPGEATRVHCIVDSSVVGVAKPDPAIFDHALPSLPAGIDRHEIAYVGDSYRNDVVGASAAGLIPFHLDPFDDHPDAAHRRIRSIAELVTLVI